MEDLNESVNNLRLKYREIFLKSADEIKRLVDDLKPDIAGEIFDKYEKGSVGFLWQQNVLKLLNENVSKDIYIKLQEILAYRNTFKCIGCGTCCKLACSEFSYSQLKEKAHNGDNFANQFLSVFIPYESKEDARKIYPEYIKMLEDNKEDEVYFYHCPKLTEDNRCSDYENRPQICRDFPDNPLTLLPKSCGYKTWKDEVEPLALALHSMIEIIDFYKNKIKDINT